MTFQGREKLVAAACFALLLPLGLYLFTDAGPEMTTVAVTTPSPAAQGARHVLLLSDDWCPVSCAGGAGQPEGYGVDIARAVFSAAGYTVSYRVAPWPRAAADVRRGAAQAVVGTLHDMTPDFVFPRETIGTNINVFFTLAGNGWQYDGVASLDRVVLGVANEYTFGEPLDSYIAGHRENGRRLQVLFTDDPVMQGLAMLQAGRIGAYLDDRMVVRWTARQHGTDIALREAGVVSSLPLYVAFSPADPRAAELARIFDAGVAALRADGRLAELLANYRLTDWQPAR